MRSDQHSKAEDPRRLAEAVRASRARRAKLRRGRRARFELESNHHAAESSRAD
jgi:hypothetical protein